MNLRFEARYVWRSAHLHFVYDTRFQIEVFHWWGHTGRDKADAVANALNELGHTE